MTYKILFQQRFAFIFRYLSICSIFSISIVSNLSHQSCNKLMSIIWEIFIT